MNMTSVKWGHESSDRRDDPVSGARIIQLTSAAAISNNIYGEQPYTSPDGKRIIIARCQDFCFENGRCKPASLVIAIGAAATAAISPSTTARSASSGITSIWKRSDRHEADGARER